MTMFQRCFFLFAGFLSVCQKHPWVQAPEKLVYKLELYIYYTSNAPLAKPNTRTLKLLYLHYNCWRNEKESLMKFMNFIITSNGFCYLLLDFSFFNSPNFFFLSCLCLTGAVEVSSKTEHKTSKISFKNPSEFSSYPSAALERKEIGFADLHFDCTHTIFSS